MLCQQCLAMRACDNLAIILTKTNEKNFSTPSFLTLISRAIIRQHLSVRGNRVKIFTRNFHLRFLPTIHKKHPCTAGAFWRSGLFIASDRFLENRLASKMQSGLEGKKSSPQAFMR
jgi:hypothetical protein